MGLKQQAKSGMGNGGKAYALPPKGASLGVCVAVIDLGTHDRQVKDDKNPGKFKTIEQRKMFVAWELLDEVNPDTGGNWVVGSEYTASMHENAAVRKLVEAWFSRKFKDGEEFSFAELLGQAGNVNVAHEPAKDGKDRTYYSVAGVSPLVKGQKPGKPENVPFTWDIDDDGLDYPDSDWMPRSYGKKLSEIIQLSKQWAARELKQNAAKLDKDAGEVFGNEPAGAGVGDEEKIPF